MADPKNANDIIEANIIGKHVQANDIATANERGFTTGQILTAGQLPPETLKIVMDAGNKYLNANKTAERSNVVKGEGDVAQLQGSPLTMDRKKQILKLVDDGVDVSLITTILKVHISQVMDTIN